MYGGPRLYRFYNYEQIHYIGAPIQGWNPDVAPHEVPASEALVLDNFLIQPGKIVMRGPLDVVGDLSALSPLNVCGYSLGPRAAQYGSSTGNPSAIVNDAAGGTLAWSHPMGAQNAGDGSWAAVQLGMPLGSNTSQYLKATGFGFAIPAGATINGITVRILRCAIYNSGGGPYVADNSVKLVKGGVIQATDKAFAGAWPSSPAPTQATFAWGAYGSSTDLWGTAWTPADINDANFGMVISAQLPSNGVESAYVDMVQISINYSIGAAVSMGSWIRLSRKAVSTTATVDHWDVPLLRPQSNPLLAGGTGTQQWVSRGTASAIVTNTPTPGPRWINFDGLLYGLSYDDLGTGGTLNDANSTYITWRTKLMTQPLVQVASGTVPTALPNAPQGAYDLAGHLSRIWLLGGADTPAGGTVHSCTKLYFTIPIVSGGGTAAADWKDPISGFTNVITMDQNSDDFGVALARVRNGLLILRRESVWLLRGTTTSTFNAQPISQQVGCLDARSVVETDNGVYFMSRWGLMLTNGVTVKNVSGTVTNTLQQALSQQQQGVLAGLGGYISIGETSLGQLLVSVGGYAQNGSGNIVPIWCGLYDPKNGTWVRITSQLWQTDGIQFGTNYYPGLVLGRQSSGMLFTIGDKYLTRLEELSQSRSFVVPGLTGGAGLYDLLPSGGTPAVPIPALWVSRFAVAAVNPTQHKFAQAKRFFVDHVFGGNGLVPTTGWSVQPVNAAAQNYGSALLATVGSTPSNAGLIGSSVSAGAAKGVPAIQRQNLDLTNEIDDVLFSTSWSDVARAAQPVGTVAELYGIGLEFQRTRDLR